MQKRQIIFRAWDENHKTMIQHAFIIEQREGYLSPVKSSPTNGRITSYMQFTGLTDKNGKEIYEGDILECADIRMPVTWANGSFHVITDPSHGRSPLIQERAKNLEIIGNIYEHSHLLK